MRAARIGLAVALVFAVPALIGMWRQSFWLDETITLFPLVEGHGTLLELAANLDKATGSIAYTPLYVLLSAAWASISPPSEFWLRLVNLPILLACGWVAWNWARRFEPDSKPRRWALLALMATSPFYIYYSYDFRPYLLLILTGGLMAMGLLILEESPRGGLWLVCCGATIAFATQPTAVLIVPWLIAVILWDRRKAITPLLRAAVWPIAACIVPAAAIGWFYLHLWRSGGMASFGAPPTLANLFFILYEFLGFLGIGPTREQLRTLAPPPGREASVLANLRPTSADLLMAVVAALLWAGVVLFLARDLWKSRASPVSNLRGLRRVALFGMGGMLILMVFFRLKEHRVLARHVSFLFIPLAWPLFTLVVSATAVRVRNWLLVAAVLGFNLWSSGHLLFAAAYGRDDLRGGFSVARAKVEAKQASAIFFFGGWQPALLYGGGKEIGQIDGEKVAGGVRTGAGRHRFHPASGVQELYRRGVSLWCLGDEGPMPEKELLDLYAGQTVVVLTMRGTECDNKGLIRRLMQASTLRPESLGRFPFVEAFLVSISPRHERER